MSDEARQLIEPEMAPSPYLAQLIERSMMIDAIRFLAAALPGREAVWWACVCAREALPSTTNQAVAAALGAAEGWVYGPSEESRRAAQVAADAAKLDNPSSWAAMAAFWSGGSITAPDAPSVAPSEALLPAAVAGAILLAAVQTDPRLADARYRAFIASGIDIADGGNGRRPAKAS